MEKDDGNFNGPLMLCEKGVQNKNKDILYIHSVFPMMLHIMYEIT